MVAVTREDGLDNGTGDVLGLEHDVIESWICNERPDEGCANPCGVYETMKM